jgi:hypothetical protein
LEWESYFTVEGGLFELTKELVLCMGQDRGKCYQFKVRSAMRKVLPFAILWGLGNLGCSINIGSRWEEPIVTQEYTDSGLMIQRGDVLLLSKTGNKVYYPYPYNSTPNLELIPEFGGLDHIRVLEQHPDHFVVDADFPSLGNKIRWKARGQVANAPRTTQIVPSGTPVPTNPTVSASVIIPANSQEPNPKP